MATTATNPFDPAVTNPFAITAPGTPSAAAATVPGQASTREATSTGYEAATSTNERADATLRTVQDNELVQNQIAGIISGNSPLLQRARQQSLEASNARGLINSSMAVEAGTAAVIDKALPIAQQDASTFGTASQDNQRYQNSMSQFNAGEANQTGRANAGLVSNARAFTADAGNRAELSNADATNRAALQTNAQQANVSQFNAGQANDMARAGLDIQFRTAMANADNSTRIALSQFEQQSASQRQNSTVASDVYRQFQTSATNIMLDDRLDGPAKQEMIAQLQEQTRRAMLATSAMDRAGIDALLTMPVLPTGEDGGTAGVDPNAPQKPSPKPPPAAAPAPAPFSGYYDGSGGGAGA